MTGARATNRNSGRRSICHRGERSATGFTLIEVVISLAVLMMILSVAYKSLNVANTTTQALSDMAQQESDSRRVADVLVTDLRMAWTGDTSLNRIVSKGICAISFYAPTREPSARLRLISYRVVGRDLQRSEQLSTATQTTTTNATGTTWNFPAVSSAVWITVLRGVNNDCVTVPTPPTAICAFTNPGPIFVARDATDAETTDVTKFKRVTINLVVDRIVNRFPDPDTFCTSVELRSA